LKLCQDVLTNAVLVKVLFNRYNHIVDDAAVDARLNDEAMSSFVLIKYKGIDWLTTILLDIFNQKNDVEYDGHHDGDVRG